MEHNDVRGEELHLIFARLTLVVADTALNVRAKTC